MLQYSVLSKYTLYIFVCLFFFVSNIAQAKKKSCECKSIQINMLSMQALMLKQQKQIQKLKEKQGRQIQSLLKKHKKQERQIQKLKEWFLNLRKAKHHWKGSKTWSSKMYSNTVGRTSLRVAKTHIELKKRSNLLVCHRVNCYNLWGGMVYTSGDLDERIAVSKSSSSATGWVTHTNCSWKNNVKPGHHSISIRFDWHPWNKKKPILQCSTAVIEAYAFSRNAAQ